MDRAHQIKTLHMIVLAVRDYPDASWAKIVRLAPQYGRSLDPPVTADDVRALAGTRLNELFS